MLTLVNDGQGISGGHLTVGGGTFNPNTNLVAGPSQAIGGGISVIGNKSGGLSVQPTLVPAVAQTDLIPFNGITTGATLVVDLGKISCFKDASASGDELEPGIILGKDPNGQLHDMAILCIRRADGDGWADCIPEFPPGRWTFINVSGSTLADLAIYVSHVGAVNMIN